MAGAVGPAAHSLAQRLEQRPYEFDFFQAVRRLENLHPDKPRVGYSQHVADDPARFSQEPRLAFAPSTVAGYRPGPGAPRLSVHFMGLLGPNGPLPLHLTDFIRDRLRNHSDPTLARFLDVFHHRMLSLFYRAWAANQKAVQFERGQEDRFAIYLGSLFGMGMDSYRRRDAVPDLGKLHFAGPLVCQTRHPSGLAAILGHYLRLPVQVLEFRGQWIHLPPDCQCRLGQTPQTGLVGQTLIVGSRVWECQMRFRLRLGPMKLAEFRRLLPGGCSLDRLVAWVRNYVGDTLSWDVQLVLEAAEVPAIKLGGQGQLGWTTWLRSRPFTRDADEMILEPQLHSSGLRDAAAAARS